MAIRKKKKVCELPLFLGLVRFNCEYFPVFKNLQKDIKITYGRTIADTTSKLIVLLQSCYENEDINHKHEIVKKLIFNINTIFLYLKILVETREITPKKFAFLTLLLNDVLTQATSWESFIVKKITNINNNDSEK